MKILDSKEIERYVEQNIDKFHQKRLEKLCTLKLKTILKRKNPYLFKAKNVLTASDLVKYIVDAHLSSQEETIFGEFLEGLAVFVNMHTFDGSKSSAEGIDLEFFRDNIRYLVSIKSGPNWGNASQIKKMKDNFNKAKRILQTNTSQVNIVAVNGCCYGRLRKIDKGTYIKLCGQRFWEFISGDDSLYITIIEPLGFKAKQKNELFYKEYAKILNLFTDQFFNDFCFDGEILWDKLVKFNSSTI